MSAHFSNLFRKFLGVLIVLYPSAEAVFGLHCWRDHPNTKVTFGAAISEIRRYVDSEIGLVPGQVLRAVSEAVWPAGALDTEMYCFSDEIHGNVSPASRKKLSDLLEGFRPGIDEILNSTRINPRDAKLRRPLHELHVNISFYFKDFLQVVDIEKSSLYLREYSLLLLGAHAEIVNFDRASRRPDDVERRLQFIAGDCYALSKFSYWFQRFIPKKMADDIVFDAQKFEHNKLGFMNKVNGRRLSRFDEILFKCSATDSNNCNDHSLGYLKAVRITTRQELEDYWKDVLVDFRRQLFRYYCRHESCTTDRYPEFYIKVGEPVALQYQASNGENGKFCGKDYCSTMWMSNGGYFDFIYYRVCPGDNALAQFPTSCPSETWRICTDRNNCDEDAYLTNNHFPVALRTLGTGKCIDCSETTSWCKQANCLEYATEAIGAPNARSTCASQGPQECRGPQFQIHNFERESNRPLEVLDEVHFLYASAPDGNKRFLSADIFSGAFFRTQYYLRTEHEYSVSSTKTGLTSGPFSCPTDKPWSLITDEERTACAQSSFTIFKRINPESIISTTPDLPQVSSRDRDDRS